MQIQKRPAKPAPRGVNYAPHGTPVHTAAVKALQSHTHVQLARSFAALPSHLNPVKSPAALAALPVALQPAAQAVIDHPQLAAVATGVSIESAVAGTPADTEHASDSPASYDSPSTYQAGNGPQESAPIMNTAPTHRLPGSRHNAVGFAPNVFAAASTQTSTARPQSRFRGMRLVIPSSTLAGSYLSNLLVGAKPQYAASSLEPTDMFEEQSTGATWDLDVCDVGQVISMAIQSPGAQTVYAALVGEALDGKQYPQLRSPLKRIGFTTGAIAAGASGNVVVSPQIRFKGRKLILNDATAAKFIINSLTVGIAPQFLSGDAVPAACFTEISQDLWLDLDEAYIGNTINMNVTNIDGAAAHSFEGAFAGDVTG